MKTYPSQVESSEVKPLFDFVSKEEFTQFIIAFLEEELPECSVNEWFIRGVHFPTMVERLVDRLNKEFLSE